MLSDIIHVSVVKHHPYLTSLPYIHAVVCGLELSSLFFDRSTGTKSSRDQCQVFQLHFSFYVNLRLFFLPGGLVHLNCTHMHFDTPKCYVHWFILKPISQNMQYNVDLEPVYDLPQGDSSGV